jgi:predicted RNA polymerase sigma factor
VVALMGVAHVMISRRRGKHRPPRAPVAWLTGFARRTIERVRNNGPLSGRG